MSRTIDVVFIVIKHRLFSPAPIQRRLKYTFLYKKNFHFYTEKYVEKYTYIRVYQTCLHAKYVFRREYYVDRGLNVGILKLCRETHQNVFH